MTNPIKRKFQSAPFFHYGADWNVSEKQKFEIFSSNTYVKKVLCERIHGHIKDTVKFDIA